MSLIDQLGGYEKAKSIYDNAPPQSDNYANGLYYEQWQPKSWVRFDGEQCTDCKKPKNPIHLYSLYLALLEYRRQHNIFEEGDKTVFVDDFMHDELMVVAWARKGEVWMDEGAKRCTDLSMIRHATDAEVDANRRLDL